jgi:hypothetical protein
VVKGGFRISLSSRNNRSGQTADGTLRLGVL